jgi:outer membrane receptor for ferrienterochelin and colicin
MKYIFTLLTFILSIVAIQAQNGIIKGFIISEQNKTLANVNISILSSTKGTISNENGEFEIKNIAPGNYTLLISFIGYENHEVSVKVNPNETTVVPAIFLKENVNQLLEVVLSSKIGVTQVEPQKVIFSTKDLPSQNGGTAGDILKNMLSVAMGGSPNHNRDIRYRGLGNGYTTVLINGKQSGMSGNNRETVLDMIPASQIDFIEIISNPGADQTSNGINGILNVVLKKGTNSDSNGQISFFTDNQNGYNGNVALKHSKDNFAISGSYDKLTRNANKFDDGSIIKYNNDGSLKESSIVSSSENKSFDNNTASAKIGYFTKNNWNFKADYIFSKQYEDKDKEELNLTYKNDDSFKNGKKTQETEDKTIKFNNPSLSLTKKWDVSTLDIEFSANFSDENKDKLKKDYATDISGTINYKNLPNQETEAEKINFKNYFPSIAFKSNIGNKISIKTGFQGFLTNRALEKESKKLNNSTNEWAPISARTFVFDLIENTYAGYVTTNLSFEKTKVTVGYRHEFKDISTIATSTAKEENKSNYHLALPNLNVTYSLTEKSYLKSSVGRRVRRPAYNDMNPFEEVKSSTEIKIGNPDLKPEKAWAYELGYINEIKTLNFGVNVFHRNISDLIQKSISTNETGVTIESFTNLNKAVSSGTEFLIGLKATKWYNININYSMFWSEIKDNSSFNGDALKDQTDWTFKSIHDFKLPKNINIQVVTNVVGPKETKQEQEKTIWFTDLGLEKQLFTNGFFSFRVSDVFDTLKKEKTKNTIVQIERKTENTPGTIISAGLRWQF